MVNIMAFSNDVLEQPRPQGLLLVQNGGRRNPWPRLPKWLQKFVRISSYKHDEMSLFCLNNGFWLQKTNRAPDAGNNLRKSHFITCHVTKYSTILGVFQQPWPGVSATAILNEEKALGTRLVLEIHHYIPKWNALCNWTHVTLRVNSPSMIKGDCFPGRHQPKHSKHYC